MKVKEKIYLEALENYKKEINDYNNIKRKDTLCNYKIFLEKVFIYIHDAMRSYQNVLRDNLDNLRYLENELNANLMEADPIRDAQVVLDKICGSKTDTTNLPKFPSERKA